MSKKIGLGTTIEKVKHNKKTSIGKRNIKMSSMNKHKKRQKGF